MQHDIADGLTGDEARAVVAQFLHTIEAHDAEPNTRGLHRGLLNTVRLAEMLATTCEGDASRAPAQAVAS